MCVNLFRFLLPLQFQAGSWLSRQEGRPEGLADIEIDTMIVMTDAAEVADMIGEHFSFLSRNKFMDGSERR